ncbi:MAG: hypothetical protein ACLQJL_10345 [Roseiarcus sp.]
MPPLSYIVAAVLLIGLVVASLPPTMGYAILLWYWVFAAAACLLAVGGTLLVGLGMRAPLWVSLALASPGVIWAARSLFDLFAPLPLHMATYQYFSAAGAFASTAAAIASLRLVELIYSPNIFVRIAIGVLVLSALLVVAALVSSAVGSPLYKIAIFSTVTRIVGWPVVVAKFGAFAVASISIVRSRKVEWWTAVAVSFVSAISLYEAARGLSGLWPLEGILWLKPVMFLIGGAALWRMGTLLQRQARQFQVLDGVAG